MQELGEFVSSTTSVLDVHADVRNKVDEANCEKDPILSERLMSDCCENVSSAFKGARWMPWH